MTQLETSAMGPQHIPELHREMSGTTPPAVARYAIEHEVTFDPAAQRFSRDLVANDPDQFKDLDTVQRQVVVHSAMSVPELSAESGNYTTADINADPKIVANGAQYSGPENWRSSARISSDAEEGMPDREAALVASLRAQAPLRGYQGKQVIGARVMSQHSPDQIAERYQAAVEGGVTPAGLPQRSRRAASSS